MSALPFYWVDAFTDRPFGGNPAAVVPLESWLPDAELARMAAQHNLSETAYFVPEGEGRYHLRWFTPAVEVDLCGHATLATAHVLFQERAAPVKRLTFATRSGPLHVERGAEGLLTMDFPAQAPAPVPAPAEMARAFGAAPAETLRMKNSWFCVFDSEDQVRGLRPDHAALARFTPGRFIVTAPGSSQGVDFVSRFFAPDAGIAEDPVTGSAHCVLTPYWAQRLGKHSLHALQVSARGGELWCELAGERVRLSGRAVTYLKGELRR